MTYPQGQPGQPYPQQGGPGYAQPQQAPPGYGQPPQSHPAYGQPPQAAPYGYGQPQLDPYGQQAFYGQPQSGFGGPPGGGQDIPDYKGWAIGCIFLFWILAIFAIIKSNEVNTYKMQGNLQMARDASNTTKTMCLVSTIVGAVGWLFSIIWIIVLVSAAPTYPY